jgi:calcium/calmodulin-dependent protein kinase I
VPNDVTSVNGVSVADKDQKVGGAAAAADGAGKFDQIFKIGQELGTGNYSVVKLATHRQSGEKCAVKCIKRADLPREDEEALMMEVQILGSMTHPNIVCMKGFYKEKHFYYLVMELLKGGELFDRIVVKQYYNEKEARDVLKVLLQAIDYCHDVSYLPAPYPSVV